ncbi:MAG: RagB/SusD family nutrient uptake outer membrane protein [Cytophagales bacterium]|nr:RagB/SusD family nutrient uptake outer membrane protein [Cytophagales bacterium]
MKQNIIKKIAALSIALTFFNQSCTNLDEEIYSDVTADNFFKTNEEFISALGQAYASLGGLGNHSNLWSVQEISSDELVITTKGGDWYDGGVLIQLHQHNWTIDNGFFNNTWQFLYGGINNCNRLIYQFGQSDAPQATAFINELRALRALWYYWLLDSFGNVPLVVDFKETSPVGNSTRAQVFAFVESELNAVINNLPTDVSAVTYGRMTKWTAHAIKCKLYLNAEVYTGTAKWTEAAAEAQAIISSGKYNLESSYKDNFSINNAGSTENIFVYPYDKVFAGGFNWPMMTLHYASQGVYKLTAQPWNGYSVVEEFYNSYIDPAQNPGPQGPVWKGLTSDLNGDGISDDNGTVDSRLSNFVVGPQFNPDGTRASDPGFEGPTTAAPDPDGAPLTFTPQINQIYPNGWRQGGARIGKYQYEVGGTNNMSNDFVVFRYADILLSRAEALWRLNSGSAEALTLVNQIRTRAGVTAYGSLTADNLVAERGREMFAEMTRRQDLIRFDKWGSTWWEKPVSTATYKLFPIPKAQRDVNSLLQQNPGYPN